MSVTKINRVSFKMNLCGHLSWETLHVVANMGHINCIVLHVAVQMFTGQYCMLLCQQEEIGKNCSTK